MLTTHIVIARPGVDCNSTNRFVPGKEYPATISENGLCLTVSVEGAQRWVGIDGHGGAHLQYRSGQGHSEICRTSGHFEIKEIDLDA